MTKKILLLPFFIVFFIKVYSQGNFSGELMVNSDFYQRDEAIGAVNTPHYDNLLSSTDAWFSLLYTNHDINLDVGIRMDMFNNSNLHNPGTPYNGIGIGRWFVRKRFQNVTLEGGYIYEQFGSGISFRTYEDRSLGIDNALFGMSVKYEPIENLMITGLAGVQKNRFDLYNPIIQGVNLEYFISSEEGNLTMVPGVALVNRTLDQSSMNLIVNTIETYPEEERFVPRYNTFVASAYNSMDIGAFNVYLEGAVKTNEAIRTADNRLRDRPGNVLYGVVGYSRPGFGASFQAKRTENFVFRTSPNEALLDGMIGFIPPTARQQHRRLIARYAAATQELEELAFNLDLSYVPVRGYTLGFNAAEIRDFSDDLLFREYFLDLTIRKSRKWTGVAGIQYMQYNQAVYEEKPGEPMVEAITPFVELTYRFNRRHSIRVEAEYQYNEQDFGSWVYGLIEYNIAPRWSFAVSDMYNYAPNESKDTEALHYYSLFASYTAGAHRFTTSYVRQVEGVICTGGVCRFEPAFSGVKFQLTTSF
ncbi:MAG: hypothetical protein EA412_05395 [Chitinophagaceae bacterium]|nr:MAG: hypothetical protein EA412_05395 [Chitinophagaceae bacterium]